MASGFFKPDPGHILLKSNITIYKLFVSPSFNNINNRQPSISLEQKGLVILIVV